MTAKKNMPRKKTTPKAAAAAAADAPAADRPQIEAVGGAASPRREFVLPKKSKVAIVGCADSNNQTPFDRAAEFEFWGVNNLHLTLPGPWTRWFEIHSITTDAAGRWLRRGAPDFRGQPVTKYLAGLQALDIPVYMQGPCAAVPNAVIYPLDPIVGQFGRYFTNTISYMIALAIAEGFQEIQVLGVDMAVDTEYFWQRPSCEYFLGICQGRGIRFVLPDECDLLKTRFLYGFQEVEDTAFNKKVNAMLTAMHKRQAKAANQAANASKQHEQYIGAIQATHEIKKIWGNTINLWPAKKGDG